MPRFEHESEGEWAIEQDGKQLQLVINGKPSTRKFISEEHAALQLGKLIADKEAAGWMRATGKATIRTDTEPREPALEQQVIHALDDRSVYAVYADWYQAQNHPRGELIALQLAEEQVESHKLQDATARHLARHKDVLLGPLAKYVAPNGISPFVWKYGFIHSLAFDDDSSPPDLVREVLAHPSGRLLQAIELTNHEPNVIEETLQALEPAAATLRDLTVLTATEISGLDLLAKLQQPRSISLISVGTDQADVRALAKLAPTVESLQLRVRAPWKALEPLFARTDLAIKHLRLHVPLVVKHALAAIATGPFAPSLETLDFAFVDPGSGLRALVDNIDRFAKLREITASLEYVPAEARNALRTKVKLVDKREDQEAMDLGQYDEDGNPLYDDVQE